MEDRYRVLVCFPNREDSDLIWKVLEKSTEDLPRLELVRWTAPQRKESFEDIRREIEEASVVFLDLTPPSKETDAPDSAVLTEGGMVMGMGKDFILLSQRDPQSLELSLPWVNQKVFIYQGESEEELLSSWSELWSKLAEEKGLDFGREMEETSSGEEKGSAEESKPRARKVQVSGTTSEEEARKRKMPTQEDLEKMGIADPGPSTEEIARKMQEGENQQRAAGKQPSPAKDSLPSRSKPQRSGDEGTPGGSGKPGSASGPRFSSTINLGQKPSSPEEKKENSHGESESEGGERSQ